MNQVAWTELRGRIYQMALGLTRNQTEAEDLTQEACLRILTNLHKFRCESKLTTWAYTILKNAWIDRHRQIKKQQEYLQGCVSDFMEKHSLNDFSDGIILRLTMDQLPELYRRALVLKEEYGLSYQEIAKLTLTSIDSVKSRIYRSRRMLEGLLE